MRRSGARRAERSCTLLFEFGGVGRRGGVTERGMRSLDVVIPDPCRDLVTSMAHVHEQRFIEQFVGKRGVEAALHDGFGIG